MTIKEVENETGMTRANIRFYEQEGLIAPVRQANGYRDYSREDVRTLEKIKLLRQFGLDIGAIRQVQRGELPLGQALSVQGGKLEGDRILIGQAAVVCRELAQSGVEYGALDPGPWLDRLEESEQSVPVQPGSPPPRPARPEEDTPRACYCPWQRWLARMLDMLLYDTVFTVLCLVLLRDRGLTRLGADSVPVRWLLGLALLTFALAVEPLWLHFWGWTPGKWVFGLKLRTGDGEKLTLSQAWTRSWQVAQEGYGWNLPIYSLWRFWQCRKTGLEGRDCHWDGEEGYRYTKEERRYIGWVLAGVVALCVAALFLGQQYISLPPNRGALTVAAFSENYNHYIRLLVVGQDKDSCPRLDGNGHWEGEGPGGDSEAVYDQVEILNEGSTVWERPEFTVEDGRVTAVTLRWVSDRPFLYSDGTRETMALLALSGSAEDIRLLHYGLEDWLDQANGLFLQWDRQETDYRGLHIEQSIESSGYRVIDKVLLANEGEEQHCEKTVTISLSGSWIRKVL